MTATLIARPFRTAAWCVLVAYSIAHFSYSAVFQAWTRVNGDFASAFPGPLTLRVGEWSWSARAWIAPAMAEHHMGMTAWNYGPVLHVVTLPFAFASTRIQALRLVLLVDYALIAATFVIWIRLLLPGRRQLLAWLGILCVWLNHFPLLEALVGREIEIFELLLIVVGIWALRKEREVLAGVAFGLAAMTKFLPVVFVPYLFVKGYRRGGAAAVITVALIALLAQVGLGWERSVTLDQASSENTAAVFPTAYANQALTNVLYKTFTTFNINNPRPPTLYPRSLRAIGTGLDAIVFLATAWFVVRWRRYRFLEVECALLMIVMCLLPSHANTYYFVFVLPALSAGVAAMYQRPAARGPWLKPLLVASIALTGFLLPMRAFEVLTHIPGVLVARVLQGWSLPFYGAILACGLMVELHRIGREQRPSVTADRMPTGS